MSDTQNLDKALNMLVFGHLVRKWNKSGKSSRDAFFYIHEKDSTILQWISQKKEYNESRIDLNKVTSINRYPTLNGFSRRQSIPRMKNCSCFTLYLPPQQGYFLQISVGEQEMVIELQTIYEQQLFKLGLEEFTKRAKEKADFENPILQLTTRYFVRADKDGNQQLSKQEIRKLLIQMQIHLQDQFFDQFFQKIDVDQNGVIDIKEFQQMTLMLMEKKEVLGIFEKYSNQSPSYSENNPPIGSYQTILSKLSRKMSSVLQPLNLHRNSNDTVKEKSEYISEEQLRQFFLEVQHQDISIGEIRRLISHYGDDEQKVNLMTFTNILFSEWNQILKFSTQRMDQPLTDYYIFSSHNTYLMSNQITGKSSVQAYKNAFYMGVKCVEIDCWDGDQEPVVTHGHTLVNKLLFSDVIKAVRDYGFVKSPYPVIISIELHCTEPFQLKMARILRDVLGDKLYTVPSDWKSYDYLPSPEQLTNKVIVKGSAKLAQLTFEQKPTHCESDFESILTVFYKPAQTIEENRTDDNNQIPLSQHYSPYLSDANLNQEYNSETQYRYPKIEYEPVTEKHTQTDSHLQKCFGIIAQKLNNDLQQPEYCWLTSSISEDTINRILETKCNDLMKYTQTNLIRVYPKGTRINSANYSVLPAMIMGCQLVALNVQTHDIWLLIYRSFFSQGEGYLLKPEFLRQNGDVRHQMELLNRQPTVKRQPSNRHQPSIRIKSTSEFTQKQNQLTNNHIQQKLDLSIHFISAQQIPLQSFKQTISPQLFVQLKGIPFDELSNQHYQSIIVRDNGFNPIFNLQTNFSINQPYFATIVIEVICQNNGRVAQAAIPAGNLRNGYRVIKLENLNGYWDDGSFIFVKVQKS